MNINHVQTYNNITFGHNNPWADSPYDNRKKYIVAGTTALGALTGMACHAKYKGYSLNPKKMFKNIKNSYWNKIDFDDGPVITIGAGSCLGGLIGGYIIDKNKENRKAKKREALLQITNISLPIISTVWMSNQGEKLGKRYFEKSNTKETFRTKTPRAIFAMVGLFGGVFAANIIANKINEKIFHQGKGRPVQASDFSAHLDDFCVAARQISKAKITDYIQKLVPFALMVAGNEVGNTTVENADS